MSELPVLGVCRAGAGFNCENFGNASCGSVVGCFYLSGVRVGVERVHILCTCLVAACAKPAKRFVCVCVDAALMCAMCAPQARLCVWRVVVAVVIGIQRMQNVLQMLFPYGIHVCNLSLIVLSSPPCVLIHLTVLYDVQEQ